MKRQWGKCVKPVVDNRADTYLSTFFLGLPFGFSLKNLLSCPSTLSIKSFIPRGRPILVFSLTPSISSGWSDASINFFHSFGSWYLLFGEPP